MSKILFLGDMAATGFGTVTMDLGRALITLGEDLRFVSQNEVGELPSPFKERTWAAQELGAWLAQQEMGTWAQPRSNRSWAGLFNGQYWRDGWKAEAVVILGDVYAVRRMVFASDDTLKAFTDIPAYHYVPIEGDGLPPSFDYLWKILHPVAMSQFGAEQIARVTGSRPPVVYHGVDTSVFHPVSREHPMRVAGKLIRTKDDAKRYFRWQPSWRVLLRVDSHWPRKDYGGLIAALRPIIEARPDAYLAMHCASTDKFLNDDLRDHLSWYAPSARFRAGSTGLHDKGLAFSREELAVLYNAADVYVSTSAEGFGLTIAEAIACGVPAVGVDYSAVPEVIGPAGVTVPTQRVRNEYAHFWCHVDEAAFGDAVADLLDHRNKRERLGRAGPAHVKVNFSWARAARQFSDLISARESEAAT